MTENNRSERKTIGAFVGTLILAGLLHFAALAAWFSGCCFSPNAVAANEAAFQYFVLGAVAALGAAGLAGRLLRKQRTATSVTAVVLAGFALVPALGVGYIAASTYLEDRARENQLTEISAETLTELMGACDLEWAYTDRKHVEYKLAESHNSSAAGDLKGMGARPFSAEAVYQEARSRTEVTAPAGCLPSEAEGRGPYLE